MVRPLRFALVLAALNLVGGCAGVGGAPSLQDRLADIGRAYDAAPGGGRVGIAVEEVATRKRVGFDDHAFYPQQSVGKLWVALAVLEAVDAGKIRLTDTVIVSREDMSVFNQPIQKLLGPDGTYTTTVDGLLVLAIAHSDNAANDILMRLAGGQAAVAKVAHARHLGAIRIGPEEKTLETRIAGLDWRPEYSFDKAFWIAREQIDAKVRTKKLDAYVNDPEDGASPWALVDAMARLKKGELLSPASTARLLDILALTDTGPLRLKAGLAQGWSIAHKTGTGQDLADRSTGYNDVGLITAPDGKTYAIVVMIASTRQPIPARQAMMAAVSRAVVGFTDPGAVWQPAAPVVVTPATAAPAAPPSTSANSTRR